MWLVFPYSVQKHSNQPRQVIRRTELSSPTLLTLHVKNKKTFELLLNERSPDFYEQRISCVKKISTAPSGIALDRKPMAEQDPCKQSLYYQIFM